jgi:hypothetical protein
MIKIRYSCCNPNCSCQEQLVTIRARSDTEDVVKYMQETVTPALVSHHKKKSPNCPARKMKGVIIGYGPKDDPNPWIGKESDETPPLIGDKA